MTSPMIDVQQVTVSATATDDAATKVSKFRNFFGLRRQRTLRSQSSKVGAGCCLPLRRHRKEAKQPSTGGRKVRFEVSDDDASTVPSVADRPSGLRVKRIDSSGGRRSVVRSASRRSVESIGDYMSCVSSLSQLAHLDKYPLSKEWSLWHGDDEEAAAETATPAVEETLPMCQCAYECHRRFLVEFPLVKNSQDGELLTIARASLGHWLTILERSESLDPQMVHIGIGKMKRMVMNRLAVPFTATLTSGDTVLRAWITTPLGPKYTTASLTGEATVDLDDDVGQWSAETAVVDYQVDWFCKDRPVRALQMKRSNEKYGDAYETRVVLPDQAEGKILLYGIRLVPGGGKAEINVQRLYRFVRPLDGTEK